ncbi:hypothetical protein P3S68_018204 [Capsicum galapagoense]
MDDSFSVRVDKVFGSLTVTSNNLSSLWCLTEDEVEKREWIRDNPSRELFDFDSRPSPPNIDGFFAKPNQTLDFPKQLQSDLEELSDGPEEEDDNDEFSEIKSCIGLDCTLDYEEEEDEFDKMAVNMGKEKQRSEDVSDYGISVDTYQELPLTLQDIKRDPRANHKAAKLRLKEDAEAALRGGYLGSMTPAASKAQGRDDINMSPDSSIPDYVRNPSKYTCYTLDVSDGMDEESNRKAYMDFFGLMRKRSQPDNGSSTDFQKSPTFNPIMKQPAGSFTKQGIQAEKMQVKKAVPLSIVAAESNAQVSVMEEDESPPVAADKARPVSLHKPGKRYRTRTTMMDADNV